MAVFTSVISLYFLLFAFWFLFLCYLFSFRMATNSLSSSLLESVIALLSHLKIILLGIEFWVDSFSNFFPQQIKNVL